MSAQLQNPGKLALASQRQHQQARLLAGVDASRAPIVPSGVSHGLAPSTPSSVDRANRANQRSAEKLLLQVMTTAAEKTLSPINEIESPPALPPFDQRVFGGDNVQVGGEVIQTTVCRPSSMFDTEQDKLPDPFFRCTASRLCRSVGDETSQMLICINCNTSAHLFCAEYLQFQNPVDELHVVE